MKENDLLFRDLGGMLSYNEFILKDLSGRFLYGVKALVEELKQEPCTIVGISHDYIDIAYDDGSAFEIPFNEIKIKPYLRSISSMTEEEKDEFYDGLDDCWYTNPPLKTDWLNKKMFDYRSLIEQGLSLEAPEGMYNN